MRTSVKIKSVSTSTTYGNCNVCVCVCVSALKCATDLHKAKYDTFKFNVGY